MLTAVLDAVLVAEKKGLKWLAHGVYSAVVRNERTGCEFLWKTADSYEAEKLWKVPLPEGYSVVRVSPVALIELESNPSL